MDHLNLFNAYKNKSNNHEDELTRSFLILLKNIPVVQMLFFEMVRKEMEDIDIESIVTGELSIEEVHTQLSNTNDLFNSEIVDGRTLVSIIISDDKLETEVNVRNDDRQARYDGVITCYPSWIFIVENKPSKENIWLGQLNPNVSEEKDIKIIEKPCCLSWREVITGLNTLVQNRMINGFELQAIEDFIEYVDNEYPWINPYTTFGVCKGNTYLLNKRCISIMSNCEINGENREVKYHRGWKHYIESGVNTVKQIALDANESNKGFTIDLWLHAGDTMSAAKETFKNLNVENLLGLQNQGFKLSNNFHISYRSSNLLWFEGSLTFEEYIRFWKSEYTNLRQIKREEFNDYFNFLEDNNLILSEDRSIIHEKILSKKYDRLNICPGISIRYTWDGQIAIDLDKSNDFDKELNEKLIVAFNTIGGL
ncbi:MAG: hypothetical protein GX962_14280 [Epulopiscium sp.]|nr:hypothetical protein [Candidatus Epulonipiscium sp.]